MLTFLFSPRCVDECFSHSRWWPTTRWAQRGEKDRNRSVCLSPIDWTMFAASVGTRIQLLVFLHQKGIRCGCYNQRFVFFFSNGSRKANRRAHRVKMCVCIWVCFRDSKLTSFSLPSSRHRRRRRRKAGKSTSWSNWAAFFSLAVVCYEWNSHGTTECKQMTKQTRNLFGIKANSNQGIHCSSPSKGTEGTSSDDPTRWIVDHHHHLRLQAEGGGAIRCLWSSSLSRRPGMGSYFYWQQTNGLLERSLINVDDANNGGRWRIQCFGIDCCAVLAGVGGITA